MRDMQKDLELCSKVTPGNWHTQDCYSPNCWCKPVLSDAKHETGEEMVVASNGCLSADDAEFMAQAKEGWPHAIRRAMQTGTSNDELSIALSDLLCYTRKLIIEYLPHYHRAHDGVYHELDAAEEALVKYKANLRKKGVE